MPHPVSVLIPFEPRTAGTAGLIASQLTARGVDTVLSGVGDTGVPPRPHLRTTLALGGKGNAIRAAIPGLTSHVTVIHDPDVALPLFDETLVDPITDDTADAVFGRRPVSRQTLAHLADRALGTLASFVTESHLRDPLTGLRAFRTSALKSLNLTSEDDGIDAEILVKLSAQSFRLSEVPIALSGPRDGHPVASHLRQARTLFHYATAANDADNAHEGYNTLSRMDGARNYNAWIGRKLKAHLGPRVLEVGAGIGTITREIEAGRELLIALEVDAFYVDRLQNLFRDKPHVRPYLSGVELADWQKLQKEQLDTVVLTNVLEHIDDDAQAVRNFRLVLQPGGKLVILVPALQQLFGAMDSAVGHHRRYSKDALRSLLESNGFEVETLEWMNLIGIPGWFFNSVLLKKRAVPPLQLRLYDSVAPALARLESNVQLPVGLSLFAVARAR